MTNSPFSPEAMKKRFWELIDQKDALNEELAPLRKKRNNMRDALRGPVGEFKAAGLGIKDVERPRMGEIDTEMAMIARALGNRIGIRGE